MEENILKGFLEGADLLRDFAAKSSGKVASAAIAISDAFKIGQKLLVFGNGGSASQSQHFAGELVGRFLKDRDGFPAIALSTDTSILTSVGNDYGFEEVFARQIKALGKKGDVALAISTSGNSPNVIKALQAAREIGMLTIGLTGGDGGKMKALLDHHINVPSGSTPRVQEVHLAILHQISKVIEENLVTK